MKVWHKGNNSSSSHAAVLLSHKLNSSRIAIWTEKNSSKWLYLVLVLVCVCCVFCMHDHCLCVKFERNIRLCVCVCAVSVVVVFVYIFQFIILLYYGWFRPPDSVIVMLLLPPFFLLNLYTSVYWSVAIHYCAIVFHFMLPMRTDIFLLQESNIKTQYVAADVVFLSISLSIDYFECVAVNARLRVAVVGDGACFVHPYIFCFLLFGRCVCASRVVVT